MTVNRFDHSVDGLGPAWGGHGQVEGVQVEGVGGVPLQSSGWPGQPAGEVAVDPVEAYFECITTCSLDDGECVTTCTEILRQHS
ncbi:MAG: hypothetical protein KFB97_12935 [Cyanobium sp. M30B3]|jgi:hypothetical protein|nr:MAG: hypothetical protein KFB97_12935 [Cyanobium sp. M30B3]